MGVIASAVRELMALGVTGDALVSAIERLEASQAPIETVSKAALRTRRWRERQAEKASPTVTEPSPRDAPENVTERHKTSPCDASRVRDKPLLEVISGGFSEEILFLETDPKASQPSLDEQFEKWWPWYPRKVSKQDARRLFGSALKRIEAPDPLAYIIDRTIAFAQSVEGNDPQFTMHPDKWLRGNRWEDHIEPRGTNDRRIDGPRVGPESRHERNVRSMLEGAALASDDGRRAQGQHR